MENNTVNYEIEEIEEVENIEQDVENTPEESNNGSGALVTGMIGGFLAYAAVSGGKKIVKFIRTKRQERKLAKAGVKNGVVDADYTEVADEQESDENAEN